MTVADPLLAVRADLADRLEQLADSLHILSPAQIATCVDEVRQIARSYDLNPLADLASACESSMSGTHSILALRTWLQSMHDAAGCASLKPDAAQVWLAALGLRLHG